VQLIVCTDDSIFLINLSGKRLKYMELDFRALFDALIIKRPFGPFINSSSPDQQTVQQY
jgi:hypothetical protein